MPKKTSTYSFGVSKREGHDSSSFYSRKIYSSDLRDVFEKIPDMAVNSSKRKTSKRKEMENNCEWKNRIFCHDSRDMHHIPDDSVALAFTSPPYCSGKDYDQDVSLEDYLSLIADVGREVYRCLLPGGRYVINVAALGRKPYIPMQALFHFLHAEIGFLPAGEIIWVKGKGQNGSCAWGSWCSAKSPRLRDVHEYLLVLVKDSFSRPDRGISGITKDEFLTGTLSVWEIPPESAKKVGHPAPFPVELAKRVISLFSYVGDVVLDPFIGSGTTAVAAKQLSRIYVGYDVNREYCDIALERLNDDADSKDDSDRSFCHSGLA
jgi:site-specific DNA-methyltransferase (adenine-specific)